MSFQERQKAKNHSDQQGNHLKATVRHLVYSRLSGLHMGLINKVDMVCLSPVGYGV